MQRSDEVAAPYKQSIHRRRSCGSRVDAEYFFIYPLRREQTGTDDATTPGVDSRALNLLRAPYVATEAASFGTGPCLAVLRRLMMCPIRPMALCLSSPLEVATPRVESSEKYLLCEEGDDCVSTGTRCKVCANFAQVHEL